MDPVWVAIMVRYEHHQKRAVVTTPQDIQAATDVVHEAREQADHMGFEDAVAQRRELIVLLAAVKEALAFTEMEMLRQVERAPRVSGGQTFVSAPDKVRTTNHELILDRMWKKALQDATDANDGHVEWELLGEAVREIVTSLYLSPSVSAKRGGLQWVGLDPRAVETETTRGRRLVIHGDPA